MASEMNAFSANSVSVMYKTISVLGIRDRKRRQKNGVLQILRIKNFHSVLDTT